ncbi:glutamate racemase [Algoriphagus sp. H41]|uniref:Glutamate racemase n=1 Tax=Algoriphagus oliviformis TaxID=2811231 RepID=A0ABS3C263_9BACT|nr:glutamate racemase [Algoriphagus oliviformis]MBN7810990.1 glutamate racemase [Algoriphagus oliviformis]
MNSNSAPIGIFDSGYGGLTVFREIEKLLPQYDYLYLGDNARAPYGPRSFETIYQYTWQAVQWFFRKGCPLVILACNTASAKALRNIQQLDLPKTDDPSRRVLGVIRPTTEVLGQYTQSGKVGVLGTAGTIRSESYPTELKKYWPEVQVYQQACPLWVPLIEGGEHHAPGADYFVKKYLGQLFAQDQGIDALLLGCTHYPLMLDKLREHIPAGVCLVVQGEIVAKSLVDYLARHPGMESRLSKGGEHRFCTTDNAADFERQAGFFLGREIEASTVQL